MHRLNKLEQETVGESKKVHLWWPRHIFEIQEKFFAFMAFPRFKNFANICTDIFAKVFSEKLSWQFFLAIILKCWLFLETLFRRKYTQKNPYLNLSHREVWYRRIELATRGRLAGVSHAPGRKLPLCGRTATERGTKSSDANIAVQKKFRKLQNS